MKPDGPEIGEIEHRIDGLLSQMTFEEKARMLAGKDAWHLWDVERLGIPSLEVADCGHGVTIAHEHPSPATCFPTSVGMASSWDEDLLAEVGKALGRECRALGISVLLGPMVNLHRLPVGGRNYETFSEDPLLAGKLGAALIRGVQSVGTGACIKAAVANNQQKFQFTSSSEVDERTLRELYVLPFEIAIREADPCAVMTSYNKLNGDDTAASALLIRTVLKSELSFQGFVVSDWRGVHDERSIVAGLDLEMPGPAKHMTVDAIRRAADSLAMTDLDDRVRRLLRAALRYDGSTAGTESALDTPEHRELARRVAEESIVLLRNEGDLLPLSMKTVRTLAVIGPNAAHARLGGGGSASVQPFYSVSPLEGLKSYTGGKIEILYAEGRSLSGTGAVATGPFRHEATAGSGDTGEGLLAEFWSSSAAFDRGERPDVTGTAEMVDFSWGWASPAVGIPRSGYALRYSGRFRVSEGGKGAFSLSWQHGGARLYVNDALMIDAWSPEDGDMFEASYRVKTAGADWSFEAGTEVRIRVEYRKLASMAALRLSWRIPGLGDPIEEAVSLARRADAVLICTGLSNMFEGGTQDRESYSLPQGQDELVSRIAESNGNIIVALQNGTPVAMPWLGKVRAVLECWYPGQEGGTALAEILFGEINPSGKLPDTFPRNLDDPEAMKYYPGDEKSMRYDEGLFVGYRDLLTRGKEPVFPFGFGLSYTRFRYGRPEASADVMTGYDGMLEISLDVMNVGSRRGKETVQLYLHIKATTGPRPEWELKAFRKILLEPGETKRVAFTLTARDLAAWSVEKHAWTAEPGLYGVRTGPNSVEGSTLEFEYRNG